MPEVPAPQRSIPETSVLEASVKETSVPGISGPLPLIPFFWDFDLTMSKKYQQVALFERHFAALKEQARREGLELKTPDDAIRRFDLMPGAPGINYMERMLADARPGGCMEGLTNGELRERGRDVEPAKGLVDGLRALKQRFEGKARLHHYIITVGLRPMVEGFIAQQGIDDLITDLAASEFLTDDRGVISGIKQAIIPFSKTEWLISSVKGGKTGHAMLNEIVPKGRRLYDYRNIIVVGDGYTDISKFSYAKRRGGTPIGVYDPGSAAAFMKAERTVGPRVDYLVPRDYTPGGRTLDTIIAIVERKLSRGCEMNPEILNLYSKNELYAPVKDVVSAHLSGCDECKDYFSKTLIAPDGCILRKA